MGIEAIVDSMSRIEQLAPLQLIWDRTSASSEGIEPPDWRGEACRLGRRQEATSGAARLKIRLLEEADLDLAKGSGFSALCRNAFRS